MTKVFATVPKKTNHVWAGKGEVVSIHLDVGVVIIKMSTGEMAGKVGGFPLEDVRFKVNRDNDGW